MEIFSKENSMFYKNLKQDDVLPLKIQVYVSKLSHCKSIDIVMNEITSHE